MFITLIICITIIALVAMLFGTFVWFMNFTHNGGSKKVKERYDAKYKRALEVFDEEVEQNKKIAEEAIKERDLYIEKVIKRNKELEEQFDRQVAIEKAEQEAMKGVQPIESLEE